MRFPQRLYGINTLPGFTVLHPSLGLREAVILEPGLLRVNTEASIKIQRVFRLVMAIKDHVLILRWYDQNQITELSNIFLSGSLITTST